MKKIFTLAIAALAALSVNASTYDIGAPTNNTSKGDSIYYNSTTNLITFYEANDYKPGWWLAWNNTTSSNSGQDYSDYENFVVELSNISDGITVQVYFEYVDETISPTIAVADANGKITVPLDANGKSAVKQAYLQASAPGTATFVKAYFENSKEDATSAVIYSNTTNTTPIDWADNKVSVQASDFSTDAKSLLVAGNYLNIDFTTATYENEDDRYYQTQIMGNWWTILPSSKDLPNTEVTANNAITSYEAGTSGVSIKLADGDIDILKQQGLLIAGHGIIITNISLDTTAKDYTTTGINNIKADKAVDANAPIYNLAGQQVTKAYKGVVIQNGRKFFNK